MLWLLLLRLYLFALVPANFAVELMKTLPSLGLRGAPAAIELVVHGAAAALAAVAGWMIYVRNPAAPRLAAAALVANAATTIQTLSWSYLPNQLAPGSATPLAAVTALHAAVWLVYLRRSTTVRRLFSSAP
jgi:hypothetical protein